jgi:hypothetical protein
MVFTVVSVAPPTVKQRILHFSHQQLVTGRKIHVSIFTQENGGANRTLTFKNLLNRQRRKQFLDKYHCMIHHHIQFNIIRTILCDKMVTHFKESLWYTSLLATAQNATLDQRMAFYKYSS